MGFNIGVSSEQIANNYECYQFIERAFYNFVNSGEQFGEESIIIQSGRYYGLDLSPLLKLVYTWDEVSQDYIQENIQNTDDLLNLVVNFRDRINDDRFVCDKIEYTAYQLYPAMSDEEKDDLIKEIGEEVVLGLIKSNEDIKKEIAENPNPWKWYFEGGRIVDDLTDLIKSIQCYKDKGATEIYLTAG